jgi:magnesium transporter
MTTPNQPSAPFYQDLKDMSDELAFFADELLEDSLRLMDVHLSLSSHRTGEIIRVLTIFSVFFMPLTFIVGIYGMNFKWMPELEHPWGYIGVWALMIGVTAAIGVWFYRKGWLRWS